VSDSRRANDAHAYVDGCLSAAERAAFEAAMARDARLRARVDAWRTQNEAIQSAFGAAPRPRIAERPSNENKPRASALRRAAAARATSRPPKAAIAALAFVALGLWAAGGPEERARPIRAPRLPTAPAPHCVPSRGRRSTFPPATPAP
jgi:anti-sigma factor RsiW